MIKEIEQRMDRCENCRHFAPEVPRELPPTCRPGPPSGALVPGQMGGVAMTAVWIPTKPEYWCNKWESLNERDVLNRESLASDS